MFCSGGRTNLDFGKGLRRVTAAPGRIKCAREARFLPPILTNINAHIKFRKCSKKTKTKKKIGNSQSERGSINSTTMRHNGSFAFN